ncbi:MAG: tRNA epoxyqueuosine(34) reductase QueG [Verrucomicrobia bacterium]|nr:tRNA epoxyqueuosine(34) reductase QueG [Verrucomicrobiota bacterium]
MKEKIRCRAQSLGFDDCRFTTSAPPETGEHFLSWLGNSFHGEMEWIARERSIELRLDPEKILPGAKTIICLAKSYYEGEALEDSIESCVARYARIPDYHKTLKPTLEQLTEYVNSLTSPAANSLSFLDTGAILERDLSQRAGIGFIGKHNNLISKKLGNWFFLAEILTTLEIEADLPERNLCGSCQKCLDACPTGALTAPWVLDSRKCLSYLTIENKRDIPKEYHSAVGTKFFGCDRCLEACPWNKVAPPRNALTSHISELPLSTKKLEQMDDASFKKKFASSPLLRAKRDGLLRNLLIAQKNGLNLPIE